MRSEKRDQTPAISYPASRGKVIITKWLRTLHVVHSYDRIRNSAMQYIQSSLHRIPHAMATLIDANSCIIIVMMTKKLTGLTTMFGPWNAVASRLLDHSFQHGLTQPSGVT